MNKDRLDTATKPHSVASRFLFGLKRLCSFFMSLMRNGLPKPAPFVSSVCGCCANEKIGMFVEMLPNEVRNVVSKSFIEIAELRRAIDDVSGYESLNDAVIDLEHVGAGVLRYVKPENLLLIFCEGPQSLRDGLSHPIRMTKGKRPYTNPFESGNHDDAAGNEECAADPRAIVLCYFRKPEALNGLRWGEKHNASSNSNYREITWRKFKELRDGGDGAFAHVGDSASCPNDQALARGGADFNRTLKTEPLALARLMPA